MAIQLSVAVRNARLNSIDATIGTTARLKLFSGSMPANCAAADSGTLLADLTLPNPWMAAASAGQKAKTGTWQDASADGTGTPTHFRIYDPAGTVCGLQGTAGVGSGDLSVDGTLTTGQSFTVTGFTLTDANA